MNQTGSLQLIEILCGRKGSQGSGDCSVYLFGRQRCHSNWIKVFVWG
jgi:hypothetical protein